MNKKNIKFTYLFVFTILFLGCIFVANSACAYLDVEANEDIVAASAAIQSAMPQVNFGGGGNPESIFLAM